MTKRISSGRGIAVTLLLCALLALLFNLAMNDVSGRLTGTQEQTVASMIERAVVTCYAVEGRYPPSLEYLCEAYGLTLDTQAYAYEYELLAHNIRPTVTVERKEAGR